MSETRPQRSVYLIGPESGPLKIGSATDAKRRLGSIQTGHPERLIVHASWEHEAAYEVEAMAHEMLTGQRLHGEWFGVSVADAAAAVERAVRLISGEAEDTEPIEVESFTHELPLFDESLVPIAEALADEQHRLGYARAMRDASAEMQTKWMVRSGVDPLDIYTETDNKTRPQWLAAIKDFREGDTLLIWSVHVIQPITLPLELQEIAARKGARVAFAHGALL